MKNLITLIATCVLSLSPCSNDNYRKIDKKQANIDAVNSDLNYFVVDSSELTEDRYIDAILIDLTYNSIVWTGYEQDNYDMAMYYWNQLDTNFELNDFTFNSDNLNIEYTLELDINFEKLRFVDEDVYPLTCQIQLLNEQTGDVVESIYSDNFRVDYNGFIQNIHVPLTYTKQQIQNENTNLIFAISFGGLVQNNYYPAEISSYVFGCDIVEWYNSNDIDLKQLYFNQLTGITSLQTSVNNLEFTLNEMRTTINNLNQQVSSLNSQIVDKNNQIQDLNGIINLQVQEINSLNSRLNQANTLLEQTRNSLTNAEITIQQKQDLIDELEDEIYYLEIELNTLVEDNTELMNLYNGAIATIEDLRNELGSVTAMSNIFDILHHAFDSVGAFLTLEIAPNIPLVMVLGIPIVIAVIFFVLKVLIK